MRKFIIPIQFIVVMLSFAFSGYAEEPKERIKNSVGIEFLYKSTDRKRGKLFKLNSNTLIDSSSYCLADRYNF